VRGTGSRQRRVGRNTAGVCMCVYGCRSTVLGEALSECVVLIVVTSEWVEVLLPSHILS
jgi:hypothetical protein